MKGLAEYGKFLANGVLALEKTLFPGGHVAKRVGLLERPRKG
jgi:hypothetical protein